MCYSSCLVILQKQSKLSAFVLQSPACDVVVLFVYLVANEMPFGLYACDLPMIYKFIIIVSCLVLRFIVISAGSFIILPAITDGEECLIKRCFVLLCTFANAKHFDNGRLFDCVHSPITDAVSKYCFDLFVGFLDTV